MQINHLTSGNLTSPSAHEGGPAPGRGPFASGFLTAADLVGKKWTGGIVWALFHGHDRFSDIEQVVPGLSARMLSLRLKELEASGVIHRDVVPDTPVRVTYRLTEKGLDLRDVLRALDRWAHRWPDDPDNDPAPPDGTCDAAGGSG